MYKRQVYVFGTGTLASATNTDWLVAIAGFTIVASSVVALHADNLKRRLAYSTISQLSYIVLAAAILAPLSLSLIHIYPELATRGNSEIYCGWNA